MIRSRSRSAGSGSGSDEEGEFEVEAIRDKQYQDGQWVFLVKWKGWESDTNTWEPKEHLDDCKVSEELGSNFCPEICDEILINLPILKCCAIK